MFIVPSEYWEVKKTEDKGKGVFAKRDIAAGIVIGDYLGVLIREKEEDLYEKKHGFYTMYYHERASIFPDITQEGIHLINHSCMPNCYMYSYKGHTLYFALRHIFAGEELVVSYLINPLDETCTPCTHICICATELCTNTMHLTQKQHETWTTYDGAMTENVKLPCVTYGKQLQKLPIYPENIADAVAYPLFGSNQKSALPVLENKMPSQEALRALIRKTGQQIYLPKIGITVLGISEKHIICKAI